MTRDSEAQRGLPSHSGPALHLRVFLASPGDVGDERTLALAALEQLPYDPLLRGQVTVEAVAWDKPSAGTPMLASMTPQEAIAVGLPKPSQCDIVVVVLWSRMGTPLPAECRKPDGGPYRSGTEWEFLDALATNRRTGTPEVLVYRRKERCALYPDDPAFEDNLRQHESVKAFFAEFTDPDGAIRHGINDYGSPADFREALNSHLRATVRRLLDARSTARREPTRSVTVAPLWEGSPFPGLRAFTPDDAPIFFGRGRETDELVRRLSDASTRFLMVVGASGSGKSSLVAAGLLPRLAANATAGAKDWLLPQMVAVSGPAQPRQWAGLRFTPGETGDNPFVALAVRLAPLLSDPATPARRVAERLEADPARFAEFAQSLHANRPSWAEVLLFIDQFEELFTLVAPRHQAPFVDMLAAAVHAPRVRVVATLRADFYHRCVEQPALAEMLRAASYPLAAPGPAALLEMVTGPAARAGLDFDDDIPSRIVDDTGSASGALALLAFALDELYRIRTPEGRLTWRAYNALSGVRGAISRRADATLQGLPAGVQARLGVVFRELVEVDEQGAATRRRAAKTSVASSEAAGQLVDAFVDARLLVTDRGLAGHAMVEVAHEALLRQWPRLAEWIAERADDFRLRRYIEAAAAEWARSGRDASHQWPHERLVRVHEALARLGWDGAILPEPARSFLRPEVERVLEELERPQTSHARRAEIGDRLDTIGDSRPGVGLRPDGLPDIVWCEVPVGTVTWENIEGRFEVGSFFIAKYPVTYRQYRAFLDDPGGYRDRCWWEGLQREPEPGEQYRSTGNCPAEWVSWYDAMACCRWLSARLGYEVRLPTDLEWLQVATGGNSGNEYPWGAWADGKANTNESGLRRTTAVGMYPGGASLQGVLDLAGNVWEWCLSDFFRPGDPAHTAAERRDEIRRVVRGGSWGDARDCARCAFSYGGRPDLRISGTGFRVVRGSPIP